MEIRCDYPGGNIVVESVGEGEARVRQDLRDTSAWWFYWAFEARSDAAVRYRFRFTDGQVVSPLGPAYSANGGPWDFLGGQSRTDDGFVYPFAPGDAVRFCWAIPYQLADFERFAREMEGDPAFHCESLGESEGGRPLLCARVGRDDAPRKALFTCRHHACESTASYVLEGLLREAAALVRAHPGAALWAIPFVDVDGVEAGDQGKERAPHDHNRDYRPESIYAATRATMALGRRLRPEIFLDLHCPYMWAMDDSLDARRNDHPFMLREPGAVGLRTARLGELLRRRTEVREAPAIRYDPVYDMNAGEGWYSADEAAPMSLRYFANEGAALSTVLEFAYFGAETPHRAAESRAFGQDLARATFDYIGEG